MTQAIAIGDEATLGNSFLSGAIQICIVTRDYRKCMEGMAALGSGPWRVYTFSPETVSGTTYRGQPASFSMKLCLAPAATALPAPEAWDPGPPPAAPAAPAAPP